MTANIFLVQDIDIGFFKDNVFETFLTTRANHSGQPLKFVIYLSG
jgi:hypothetical protein